MKSFVITPFRMAAAAMLAAASFAPEAAHACACGCGIFDVATSELFPDGPGGTTYLEFDGENQYINWSGNSRTAAANNDDKDIKTLFITAGFKYMFNRTWGLQVDVPYDFRTFKTASQDPSAPPGTVASLSWGQPGDIRVRGIYSPWPDLSTGLTFGLKLPTGNYTHNDAFGDVDRDTEIGTGSTDLLLGAFHRQHLTKDAMWDWFAQASLDLPMLIQDDYRPGVEFDEAVGLYYQGFALGKLDIVPVAQIIGSERTSDSGANAASPVQSGYERLLLSPGIEFQFHPVSIYADVEVPVFQHVRGNQLVAPAIFKLVFSYHF
jgi:hypothetical protein